MRSRRRKAEREPDTEKVVRLFCVHIEKKTGPAAAVKEESSGSPEGQDSAGKSSSTAPLEERMVSGRGTRQSSFPRGMRRLSFSVFIRQKKSGGASGSCSGMGVSPGRRESLRLSPFRTQWRTGPRVTQVRQRRTACARAWDASGGGSGALSPSVSINVEKTPSRSMGRWRSRPLTGAMGKPDQASRIHHWMAWQLSGTMGWALFTISMKSMSPGS